LYNEAVAAASTRHTELIKRRASELGFARVGISRAKWLEDDARRLETWLAAGMHGKMTYMENHFDKRIDPKELVPGARSVISLIFNYYPRQSKLSESTPKISKYAYGRDYHFVLKEKLYALLDYMREEIGDIRGRVFVDSAPVLERAWAAQSGLGWIGKNANLLRPKDGSFFFLAEIICDLELDYDRPIIDHCGSCRACIDACPTEAIVDEKLIDARKCISYLTIELRERIPEEFSKKMEGWVFGCDICQDVCPFNRFSKPHNEPQFDPHPDLEAMTEADWQALTKPLFKHLFKDSAMHRSRFAGLRRNLDFVARARKEDPSEELGKK
jgi:epoxyqueuosine reductase